MRIRAGLPRGVSALFYEDARRRRQLEWRLSRALEQRGFGEVILPILDYFAPYETLLADSEKERLYRFVDRDGQLLALRGDFTPLLARLLAPRLDLPDDGEPLRLFYRGDVIRHQESGPNRVRESSQLGAEVIAAPGSLDDRALLEISLEVLLALIEPELPELPRTAGGERRIELVLGFAGSLDEFLRASEQPGRLAAAVARRDRDATRQLAGEHAGLLLEVLENGVPREASALGEQASGLHDLLDTAKVFRQRYADQGVGVSVDLAEFVSAESGGEGLHHDYYCGPVYRLYLPGAAAPLALGGRYDALFETLGAEVVAGGFSLGLDQLLDVNLNGYHRTASGGDA